MTATPTPRQRLQAALRIGRAVRLVWNAAPQWTLANAALVVVQGGLPLAALYLMKRILDAVSAAVAAPGQPELVDAVWLWIGLAAGVGLFTALMRLLAEYTTQAQSLVVTDSVAEILHAQSIAVDLAYYEDPSYYDTLHRAQGEAPYRPSSIVTSLIQIAQNSLALAGIVTWLIYLNWIFGLVLILGVVPGVIARLVYSRKLYGLHQAQTERERRSWYYHAILTEAQFAKELRIFNLGAVFQSRYRDLRQDIRSGTLTLARNHIIAELFGQVVATAALFGFLAWVALQTMRGAVTIGDLAVYFLGFQSGLSLLQTVLRSLAKLYEDNLFLTNLYTFLDLKPTITLPRDPQSVPKPVTGDVRFQDVSFRYGGQSSDAVSGVDLTIGPGEVVALVGENGSGKSTLAKLLCRLYDPTSGAITAGGTDLRRFDPVEWRREISVTFQDYVHYALTAKENIWLGDVTADPAIARIAEAGRRSGADHAIGRLPGGYEAQLGRVFPGGHELSEGEWQRVAMARAHWRGARILILDEPSSALDPIAEADLLAQFRELLAGRSALVISHRLSTVQMADRIYVLDRGKIVETGTHTDLLHQSGHYARLYRAQAQHYQDG